jgi:hypothetical protein
MVRKGGFLEVAISDASTGKKTALYLTRHRRPLTALSVILSTVKKPPFSLPRLSISDFISKNPLRRVSLLQRRGDEG